MLRIYNLFLCLALYCLLIFSPFKLACEDLPVFMLGNLAWDATDIVIVTAGDSQNGRVIVKECWKGSLSVGDQLSIAGLFYLTSETDRRVFSGLVVQGNGSPTVYVNSKEMILFLKRRIETIPAEGSDDTKPSENIVWQAASQFSIPPYGGFKVSTAWIENGETYVFEQISNPGPQQLLHHQTIQKTKEFVMERLALQQKYKTDLAIASPDRRVAALLILAKGQQGRAQEMAIDALGNNGTVAAPALWAMFQDRKMDFVIPSIREALVKSGGTSIGKKLKSFVKEQSSYWRINAPGLKADWQNDFKLGSHLDELRWRSSILREAIIALRQIHYSEARKEVNALLTFWRLSPQLDNQSDFYQISHECEEYLKSSQTEDDH
jgi:hypothetical protein